MTRKKRAIEVALPEIAEKLREVPILEQYRLRTPTTGFETLSEGDEMYISEIVEGNLIEGMLMLLTDDGETRYWSFVPDPRKYRIPAQSYRRQL